jgi:hypothetical protein
MAGVVRAPMFGDSAAPEIAIAVPSEIPPP